MSVMPLVFLFYFEKTIYNLFIKIVLMVTGKDNDFKSSFLKYMLQHLFLKSIGVMCWQIKEFDVTLRWVVGSILHGVDPLSYFSFQPVLHDWCNKGRGMCYPVCGMVHIKEPLLLIVKSSLCGGSGFPFSLSE